MIFGTVIVSAELPTYGCKWNSPVPKYDDNANVGIVTSYLAAVSPQPCQEGNNLSVITAGLIQISIITKMKKIYFIVGIEFKQEFKFWYMGCLQPQRF